MSDFITYRELVGDEMGYFICQKEHPHYLCRISERPIVNFIEPVPVTSYNLFIVFFGCLRGEVIPVYNDIDKEVAEVMFNMGLWFYSERILIEPKKYKKWKI